MSGTRSITPGIARSGLQQDVLARGALLVAKPAATTLLAIFAAMPVLASAQHAGRAHHAQTAPERGRYAAVTAETHDQHSDHAKDASREHEAKSPPAGHPHAAHASPAHAMPVDATAPADVRTSDPHVAHAPSPASPAPLPPPTPAEVAAAFPDLHGMRMQDHMDDDPVLAALLFDRLEHRSGDGDRTAWELEGWVGDLEHRAWLRSEGQRRDGRTQHGDVELFWGRPTGPWWDLLMGIRHDLGPGPSRDWLAFGVQGLAPYKFEVAATAYLGTGGRAALRAEAEYDVLLTNRLILQPRIEANLHARDDPARGLGRGLSDASLGLRLRYELTRRFAPYVGYEWQRSFGRTAGFGEAAGEPRSDAQWLAGVRFWF